MARPSRPCVVPRCPRPATAAGRCPEHARPVETTRQTDPEQARFYSSYHWQKIRAQIRKEEPICRICRARPTASIDHINGRWDDNRRENLRGLCDVCEPRRTGRQHASKGRGGDRHSAAGPSTPALLPFFSQPHNDARGKFGGAA